MQNAFDNAIICLVDYDYNGFKKIIDTYPDVLLDSDEYNRNIFHFACAFQREEIIELLLKDGMDPNQKNSEEHTPFEVYLRASPNFTISEPGFNPIKKPCIDMFIEYGAFVTTMTLNNFEFQQSRNPFFANEHKDILCTLEKVWAAQNDVHYQKPKRPNPRPKKFRP